MKILCSTLLLLATNEGIESVSGLRASKSNKSEVSHFFLLKLENCKSALLTQPVVPLQCQSFFNEVTITSQGNPVTRGEPWEVAAQMASTGLFTSASWKSEGTVTEALIHCTVIQLGSPLPEYGGFPAFIKSQCDIPILFDNGDIMFWHGVETLNPTWYPPQGGSEVPFAIEGGVGEWVGASGEGKIQCEFFDPPLCTAQGVVCKSSQFEEIKALLDDRRKD